MSYMSPFENWQGQQKHETTARSATMNQSDYERKYTKQGGNVQTRTEPTQFEKYVPGPNGEISRILKDWLKENGLKLGEARPGYKAWTPPKKRHHGAGNSVK